MGTAKNIDIFKKFRSLLLFNSEWETWMLSYEAVYFNCCQHTLFGIGWFYMLTCWLAVYEFIALDLLTSDPERKKEKRYDETARFSVLVGEQKIMINTEYITSTPINLWGNSGNNVLPIIEQNTFVQTECFIGCNFCELKSSRSWGRLCRPYHRVPFSAVKFYFIIRVWACVCLGTSKSTIVPTFTWLLLERSHWLFPE